MRAANYADHVVTLVDILGFKNFIAKRTAKEAQQLLSIFAKAFKADEGDAVLGRKTTWFSDTLVTSIPLVMPNGSPQLHGVFYSELAALAIAQADIFDQMRVFIRGAITIGLLTHETNSIFGPALVSAHEIEQSTCFPRIEIDKKLMCRYFSGRELTAKNHPRHSLDYRGIKPLIRRDTNAVRYIDYVTAAEDNLDNPDNYPTFVGKHRDAIVEMLKFRDNKIQAKFRWLAAYHNSVVAKHPILFHGNQSGFYVPI